MEVYMELEKEVKIEDKDTAKKTKNVNEKEEINIGKIKIDEPEVKITFKRILMYFIIYSFLGFIVETIFGMLTKGVIESRKSCFYGPFCCIYGLGAAIMIPGLQKFKRNNWTLAIGGMIEGSIIEYVVSWIGEIIFQIKWWDYSNMPLNINGRICVYYSIFWGFLGIYLIASLNPKIDKIIDWTKSKFKTYKGLKTFVTTVCILLLIDCISTAFALEFFLVRMIVKYDLNVENRDIIQQQYDKIYNNEKLSNFIYKFWGDKKMIRTFPNIKITDKEQEIIYMDSLLPDIQPYYTKVHVKNFKNSEEVEKIIQDLM